MITRKFIGRHHNIPHGTIVKVIKYYPRRKVLVDNNGTPVLTFSTLLRKINK